MSNPLAILRANELSACGAFIGTPEGLLCVLRARREVIELREAIYNGAVLADDIIAFAQGLFADFCRGEAFPWEVALSSIAVALERSSAPFADGMIREVADLRIAEIPRAWRLAELILEWRRRNIVQNTVTLERLTSLLRRPDSYPRLIDVRRTSIETSGHTEKVPA